MRALALLRRSLAYYWRTNLAVVAGVAVAVAVLAGALTVGVSVRRSLRELAVERLGEVDHVVLSTGFFREALAADLESDPRFSPLFQRSAPIIVLQGFATNQTSSRRASRVQVYAVDDRFWRFQRLDGVTGPQANDAFLSEGLATELAAEREQSVLLRIENESAIPVESLFGRKEDVGRTIRFTVRRILPPSERGEFSLNPRQGTVHAIFVSLQRMQAVLAQQGRANALLLDARGGSNDGEAQARTQLESIVRDTVRVDDFGLKLRWLDEKRGFALESTTT